MKKITNTLFASSSLVLLLASAAHAQGHVTSTPMNPPNATGHYSIPSNDDAIRNLTLANFKRG